MGKLTEKVLSFRGYSKVIYLHLSLTVKGLTLKMSITIKMSSLMVVLQFVVETYTDQEPLITFQN